MNAAEYQKLSKRRLEIMARLIEISDERAALSKEAFDLQMERAGINATIDDSIKARGSIEHIVLTDAGPFGDGR